MKHWYLLHTKIRQERLALDNLERQGYTCFLPLARVEKLRRGRLTVIEEALFPRYLFIQLGNDPTDKSWGPIRSTLGVSRLITFGQTPARIDDALINDLRQRSASQTVQQRHFEPGESLVVTEGPFAGVEAIYQMTDGEGRVMILFEMLSQPVKMAVAPAAVRKQA